MTHDEKSGLGPEEREALEGEELPDREVMSVVSPVPDGDLVFIYPDPNEHPQPTLPDKGVPPPPIDW